jgi:hypothetical protein
MVSAAVHRGQPVRGLEQEGHQADAADLQQQPNDTSPRPQPIGTLLTKLLLPQQVTNHQHNPLTCLVACC